MCYFRSALDEILKNLRNTPTISPHSQAVPDIKAPLAASLHMSRFELNTRRGGFDMRSNSSNPLLLL
jgi:hypothetical protein